MPTKKATTAKNGAHSVKNGTAKPEKGTEAYYVEKGNRALMRALERIHRAREVEEAEKAQSNGDTG